MTHDDIWKGERNHTNVAQSFFLLGFCIFCQVSWMQQFFSVCKHEAVCECNYTLQKVREHLTISHIFIKLSYFLMVQVWSVKVPRCIEHSSGFAMKAGKCCICFTHKVRGTTKTPEKHRIFTVSWGHWQSFHSMLPTKLCFTRVRMVLWLWVLVIFDLL